VKIQAAVAWEAGAELSIEEFDLDDPRDDEILVRVEAVGVCHTDDNARLGRLPVVFPIILGHEGSGVVERVGGAVTRVRPGREIVSTTRAGVNVALDATGNPAVIAAAVESLATHGTASVFTSSGAPVTVPPGSLLLKGRSLRGSMGGHINPTVFIPGCLSCTGRAASRSTGWSGTIRSRRSTPPSPIRWRALRSSRCSRSTDGSGREHG
jgi:Zn-dependent alcohol dehydrogenase